MNTELTDTNVANGSTHSFLGAVNLLTCLVNSRYAINLIGAKDDTKPYLVTRLHIG